MRIFSAIELFLFYLYEVLISNLRVAHDVLTPTHHMQPEMVYVNVSDLTDRQLLAASNLITMTPGTLSLDVSEDRKLLKVHCMYVKDAEQVARDMENNYLRRIRRVF
ncbi:MAG: Na+/H+ antiporter subunit E [Luteolibacter sp.]